MAYKRPLAHRTRFVEVDMKEDHIDKNDFYSHNKVARVKELTPQRAAQYYRKFRKSNTNSQFSNHILPFSMSYDISLRYAAIA